MATAIFDAIVSLRAWLRLHVGRKARRSAPDALPQPFWRGECWATLCGHAETSRLPAQSTQPPGAADASNQDYTKLSYILLEREVGFRGVFAPELGAARTTGDSY